MANQNDTIKKLGAQAQETENATQPVTEAAPTTEKKPVKKKTTASKSKPSAGAQKRGTASAKTTPAKEPTDVPTTAEKTAVKNKPAAKRGASKSGSAKAAPKRTAAKKPSAPKKEKSISKPEDAAKDALRLDGEESTAIPMTVSPVEAFENDNASNLPDATDVNSNCAETAITGELREDEPVKAVEDMSKSHDNDLFARQAAEIDALPLETNLKESASEQTEDLLGQMISEDAASEIGDTVVAEPDKETAQTSETAVPEKQEVRRTLMSRVRAWLDDLATGNGAQPKAVEAVAPVPVEPVEAAIEIGENKTTATQTDVPTDGDADIDASEATDADAAAQEIAAAQDEEIKTEESVDAKASATEEQHDAQEIENAQESGDTQETENAQETGESGETQPDLAESEPSVKADEQTDGLEEKQTAVSEPEAASEEKPAEHKEFTGLFGGIKKLFHVAFAPIDEQDEDERATMSDAEFAFMPMPSADQADSGAEAVAVNASIGESDVKPAEELEAKPAEESETKSAEEPETKSAEEPEEKSAEEPEAKPAEELEAKPAEESETKSAEEPEAKPAEESETKSAEEPEAKPAEEPEAKPAEELEEKSAEESEAKPAEEPEAKPAEEPEAKPAEEPEAKPAEEPEVESAEELYENERPRHRVTVFKVFVILTAVATFMMALFVVLLLVLSDNTLLSPKDEVDMPNFYGMEVSQIKGNPEYDGFQIEYEDFYTEDAEKGIVIDQRPKAPRMVKENAHITLRISAGTQTVEVPEVVGTSRDAAKSTLKKSGLNVLFKPVADDTVAEEMVVETEPKCGTVLNAGETVTVYISRGEQEVTTAKVPNCVGLGSSSAAGQLIGSRGLTVGGVKQVANGAPAGTVIGQSPAAGKVLPRGSSVTITVSTGVAVATTPGVANEVMGADGHMHQYVTQVVAPNSYSIGFTLHTCTICGYYYYDNVKNPV